MTVSTTGRMATDRPERYLKQLASHLSHKLDVETDGGTGTIRLGAATARFVSSPASLDIAVDSEVDSDAHSLMGVVGSHLDRFAEKEGLAVEWDDAGLAAAAAAARAEHVRRRQEAEVEAASASEIAPDATRESGTD